MPWHHKYCPQRPCRCRRNPPPREGQIVKVMHASPPWQHLRFKTGKVFRVFKHTAIVEFPKWGGVHFLHGELKYTPIIYG